MKISLEIRILRMSLQNAYVFAYVCLFACLKVSTRDTQKLPPMKFYRIQSDLVSPITLQPTEIRPVISKKCGDIIAHANFAARQLECTWRNFLIDGLQSD